MIARWESIEEYALDISLFKQYWESISENSLDLIIKFFEIQLKGKKSYGTYSKYSWEEISKYVFYEDIEFAMKQLEFYRDYDRFYSMQLEKFDFLVKRRNLIIELLKEKFIV